MVVHYDRVLQVVDTMLFSANFHLKIMVIPKLSIYQHTELGTLATVLHFIKTFVKQKYRYTKLFVSKRYFEPIRKYTTSTTNSNINFLIIFRNYYF